MYAVCVYDYVCTLLVVGIVNILNERECLKEKKTKKKREKKKINKKKGQKEKRNKKITYQSKLPIIVLILIKLFNVWRLYCKLISMHVI